jgi:integrase
MSITSTGYISNSTKVAFLAAGWRPPLTSELRIFGEFIDDFEAAYMPRLAAPTRDKYKSLLRGHVRPYFGSMKVSDINTKKIDEWLAGKTHDLSWATRSDLRNLVSSIFTRHERWGTFEGKNPAKYANPGRKQSHYEKRKLTVDQTTKLLAHLRPDVRMVCMIALFCGLRISEVLGLMWKHVDFDRNCLLIRQRYWRGDLDRTKSEAADRDVPFGELRELLLALKPAGAAGERYCFEIKTCKGVTRDDRQIRRYFLKPPAEKLNIYHKGFGFHAFRREAITGVAAETGDGMQASRFAGHTRMDVTLNYILKDYLAQEKAVKAMQRPYLKAGLLKPKKN